MRPLTFFSNSTKQQLLLARLARALTVHQQSDGDALAAFSVVERRLEWCCGSLVAVCFRGYGAAAWRHYDRGARGVLNDRRGLLFIEQSEQPFLSNLALFFI